MRTEPKTNSKWRTTKFFKIQHENQDLRERNEGQEKKPIAATRRGARATLAAAPHPCVSVETEIGFIGHRTWPHAPSEYTTRKRGYQHLNLATDNSVAKFSNRFATDYTYIIFLISVTDFSNGKSIANFTLNLAMENPLLIKKIII